MASTEAAKAAAVAALVDQYAQQRQARTAAAVVLVLAALRRWVLSGQVAAAKATTAGPVAAASAAATARLTTSQFAALVTPAMADSFYNPAAVSQLALQTATISAKAQQQMAALTQQFERSVLEQLGGGSPRVTAATTSGQGTSVFTSRLDVDPVDVYERPAGQFRYLRSEATPLAEATEKVEERFTRLVEDDITLAVRDAFDAIVNHEDSDASGFRRVLRPELAKYGSCGLCIAASDRFYTRGDLLPIHARCNCIVLPIVGDSDPGREINRADLTKLYDAGGGTTYGRAKNGAAGLRRVRAVVQENGELGPVLVRYGQRFLTQEEAQERRRARAETRAQRATDR